ncbi:hypothetical protein ACJZ2D_001410 [Fusarium nematophilum]
MVKRGRPALSLTPDERLERRRNQFLRSQRKTRARRRGMQSHHCEDPKQYGNCPPQPYLTPATMATAPTVWEGPGHETSSHDVGDELHLNTACFVEAVSNNSPASHTTNTKMRSDAHSLYRREGASPECEYPEYPVLRDASDLHASLCFPSHHLNDFAHPTPTPSPTSWSCVMPQDAESLSSSLSSPGIRTPVDSWTRASGSSLPPATLLEMDQHYTFPDPMAVSHPLPGASHTHYDATAWTSFNLQSALGPDISNLGSNTWASPISLMSSDGFAVGTDLLDGKNLDVILQPSAHTMRISSGSASNLNCPTIRLKILLDV